MKIHLLLFYSFFTPFYSFLLLFFLMNKNDSIYHKNHLLLFYSFCYHLLLFFLFPFSRGGGRYFGFSEIFSSLIDPSNIFRNKIEFNIFYMFIHNFCNHYGQYYIQTNVPTFDRRRIDR